MHDPMTDWRGREWAIRQMPRDWRLDDPDARWRAVRAVVWLSVRTVAVALLLAAVYAAVAMQP